MNKGSQKGMGLVEVLIAASLGLLVLAGITAGLKGTSDFARKLMSSSDLADIRASLMGSVDCIRTMGSLPSADPCAPNQWVDVKNSLGEVIVAADGSTVKGSWTLRARCQNKGIEIRAAKFIPPPGITAAAKTAALDWVPTPANSVFLKDEMDNSRYYNWSHPKAVLLGPGACAPKCPSGALPVTDGFGGVTCADLGKARCYSAGGADFIHGGYSILGCNLTGTTSCSSLPNCQLKSASTPGFQICIWSCEPI